MIDKTIEVDNQKLRILFTFNYKERDFIVYEFEDKDISASILKHDKEKDLYIFEKIESEEDWDYVDKMLEEKL